MMLFPAVPHRLTHRRLCNRGHWRREARGNFCTFCGAPVAEVETWAFPWHVTVARLREWRRRRALRKAYNAA